MHFRNSMVKRVSNIGRNVAHRNFKKIRKMRPDGVKSQKGFKNKGRAPNTTTTKILPESQIKTKSPKKLRLSKCLTECEAGKPAHALPGKPTHRPSEKLIIPENDPSYLSRTRVNKNLPNPSTKTNPTQRAYILKPEQYKTINQKYYKTTQLFYRNNLHIVSKYGSGDRICGKHMGPHGSKTQQSQKTMFAGAILGNRRTNSDTTATKRKPMVTGKNAAQGKQAGDKSEKGTPFCRKGMEGRNTRAIRRNLLRDRKCDRTRIPRRRTAEKAGKETTR